MRPHLLTFNASTSLSVLTFAAGLLTATTPVCCCCYHRDYLLQPSWYCPHTRDCGAVASAWNNLPTSLAPLDDQLHSAASADDLPTVCTKRIASADDLIASAADLSVIVDDLIAALPDLSEALEVLPAAALLMADLPTPVDNLPAADSLPVRLGISCRAESWLLLLLRVLLEPVTRAPLLALLTGNLVAGCDAVRWGVQEGLGVGLMLGLAGGEAMSEGAIRWPLSLDSSPGWQNL